MLLGSSYRARMIPYWTKLGEFISSYADIERSLFETLCRFAKTDEPTSKALFSGVRVKAAISDIKRLVEGRGETLDPWLERAFSHIGHINSARDGLLHYGIKLSGLFDASDVPIAYWSSNYKMPAKSAKVEKATLEVLLSLAHDCTVIQACLHCSRLEAEINPLGLDVNRSIASVPWQYTPPSQEPAGQKPPSAKRSRSRRNQASPS